MRNCRKCKNRFLCELVSKAGELDGAVSVIAAEVGRTPTMKANINIVIDTLFELLPKCCTRFDSKDTKPVKHVFLPLRSAVKRQIVDLIAGYYEKLGYCPTIRYIATSLNKSTATVQQHVNGLVSDGYLVKLQAGRRARNYKINPQWKEGE